MSYRVLLCLCWGCWATTVAAEAPSVAELQAEISRLRQQLATCQTVPPASTPAPTTSPRLEAVPSLAPAVAPVVAVPVVEDYSRAGCGGVLGQNRPWQQADAWSNLVVGMALSEVEALLGQDHYTQRGDSGLAQRWDYGKCGSRAQGVLQFNADGQLQRWRSPSF